MYPVHRYYCIKFNLVGIRKILWTPNIIPEIYWRTWYVNNENRYIHFFSPLLISLNLFFIKEFYQKCLLKIFLCINILKQFYFQVFFEWRFLSYLFSLEKKEERILRKIKKCTVAFFTLLLSMYFTKWESLLCTYFGFHKGNDSQRHI